ncbi:MAG: cohesin domain-containing protein [Pseudomonadota bacterium]
MNRVSPIIAFPIALILFVVSAPARATLVDFVGASTFDVVAGGSLSVDVRVTNLGDQIVSAYDLDVLYDSSFLSPMGVSFGTDLGAPFSFTSFSLSVDGIVDLAELSLLSDAELEAIQGSSVFLASINFSAVSTGQTNLAFDFTGANDVKGRNNEVIFPAPVPAPGTSVLILLGLFAMRREIHRGLRFCNRRTVS